MNTRPSPKNVTLSSVMVTIEELETAHTMSLETVYSNIDTVKDSLTAIREELAQLTEAYTLLHGIVSTMSKESNRQSQSIEHLEHITRRLRHTPYGNSQY
jgi:predicted nuclease with TOPRIM domain